ncbi:MAG: hypothetical protein ABI442_09295 [Gemmatimonadaceae bacterium]
MRLPSVVTRMRGPNSPRIIGLPICSPDVTARTPGSPAIACDSEMPPSACRSSPLSTLVESGDAIDAIGERAAVTFTGSIVTAPAFMVMVTWTGAPPTTMFDAADVYPQATRGHCVSSARNPRQAKAPVATRDGGSPPRLRSDFACHR